MVTRSICEGLRVVEIGAGSVAGSLAGMLLADNGAWVVKVEPPEGDRLRTRHEPGFLVWNRGKDSVIADLRTHEGREETRRLVNHADVVIEGFGTGVAEQWGLGYDDVRAQNPGVVYSSIKGFGSTGPYAHLKAYEAVILAKCGVFTFGDFGFRSGPIFFSAPLASVGAAQMAVGGILSALIVRRSTGRGQRVEATLAQGISPLDYFGMITWQHVRRTTGEASGTSAMGATLAGNRYILTAPTEDGLWVTFMQMLPHQAQALSRALGIGDTIDTARLARQPRFTEAEHAQEWEDRVWDAVRTKPYAEWEKIFLADPDIAFELVRPSEWGLDHPQIVHNGNAIEIDDPDHGTIEQIGPVATFTATPSRPSRSAPQLGEHRPGFCSPRPEIDGGGVAPTHPLEGVTVLELGYFYAMPFASALAASLGARVIKFEGLDGDPQRHAFGVDLGAAKAMEGKESLSLDLTSPEGQEIAHTLVRKADIFLNGFRTGVAERLRLDHRTLSELNPRLVYIHAAGYGTSGPFANRPIYAHVAGAVAGSIARYSGKWLDPELTKELNRIEAQAIIAPRLRGPIDGDSNAALTVFTALMLALYDQRCTGQGQVVSTSLLNGNALAYSDDFNRYKGKPPLRAPDEDKHGLHALYRLYTTGDGWVFLAAPTCRDWEALITGLGRPDLATDPRFATADLRAENDAALIAELDRTFGTKSAQEWENALSSKGVACVQAFTASHAEFACTDPVLRETGLVVEVDHPSFGEVLRHGLPVTFSETPGRAAAGCVLGQHVDSILAELGYQPERIAQLKKQQVVFDFGKR